jgi:predicted DNA-binding protein
MAVIRAGMVKTVRLDRRLRERLRRAARMTGRTESDLIREAVEGKCDDVLSGGMADRLADVIGSVRGDGSGYSRRTHELFGQELVREAQRRRRR